MKKTKQSILIICFSITTNLLFSQTFSSAGEYMSAIGASHEQITNDFWSYTKASAHSKSLRKIERKRNELINTIQSAKIAVKKLPGFSGDFSYRDAVANYLDYKYKILTEDYANLVDLEEIAEESFDAMEAYIKAKEAAEEKGTLAFGELVLAQTNFAESNGVTLISGESSKKEKKLKIAGEVNSYYNDIYLLFFKAFVQDTYISTAIQNNDINGIEQNNETMKTIVEENLAAIDTIPRYNSDATLKLATIKALQFYKRQTTNVTPKMTDFLLKKEKFERLDGIIKSKKQKDLTKEEIDAFNKAVNEYNASISSINQIMQKNDQEKAKMLDFWNKTVSAFFNKMVP